MTAVLDPVFAGALRAALLDEVTVATAPRKKVHRVWWIAFGGLVAVGAAGAAAASVLGWPGALDEGRLTEPVVLEGGGTEALRLGDAPAAANAVHFEFDCLTPGRFALGTNGVEVTCTNGDVGASHTFGLLDLGDLEDGTLIVSTTPGSGWHLKAWYVAAAHLPLATNANGETFGVESDEYVPDLVLAQATNGKTGYVRRSELEAAGVSTPVSPAHAATLEPSPAEVPVYESDGETIIGVFAVGG
jgi:hypothetical protein